MSMQDVNTEKNSPEKKTRTMVHVFFELYKNYVLKRCGMDVL